MGCSNDEACRTCDGRCCSLFSYSTDLAEIADRYQAGASHDPEEDLKLLALLTPITLEEALERGRKYGVEGIYGEWIKVEREAPGGFYSCRAWDEETRLCTVYEARPKMCAAYPYGDACSHGCDWTISDEEVVELGFRSPRWWFEKPYS